MSNRLQTIWNIAERHGEDVAIKALELQGIVANLVEEFGLPLAKKALNCVAIHREQAELDARAAEAERELDEVTAGMSEERSDRLLSLMFPV